MAYLLCLTSGGGVPVFSRSMGDLKPLPFPVIGSLNGVHMFGAAQDAVLQSSLTDHGKIVWKMFENSLTLILVTDDDGAHHDHHMLHFLDLVFNAVVLLCGVEDIVSLSNRNVERLKKEVKLSLNLIDYMLRNGQLDATTSMADLTRGVDVVLAPNFSHLQPVLDTFTSAASSPYGCILIYNRVALATERWWALPSLEQTLLLLLVAALPHASSRDLPVFLPIGSPKIAHRLLTFHLMSGVEICVICGPEPSLATLQPDIERFWRPTFENLRNLSRLTPRFIPESLSLDPNLLGFVLVNTAQNQCLWTVQPSYDERPLSDHNLPTSARLHFLRSYYKKLVGEIFPLRHCHVTSDVASGNSDEESSRDPSSTEPAEETLKTQKKEDSTSSNEDNPWGKGIVETAYGKHQIAETYRCADDHKCYAINAPPYQFFLLFSPTIPTYALRSVSHKTFELLMSQGSTGKNKPKG